jgi:uncharacterized protein YrrD
MLQRVKEIIGSHVHGLDGDVGKIKDVYFDDTSLKIRYLVVDTGSWLERREVLLVPSYFKGSRFPAAALTVELTRKQVEDSPPVASDMPVSRQYEERLHAHFGWMPYWSAPYYPLPEIYAYPLATGLGTGPLPWMARSPGDLPAEMREPMAAQDHGDPHLRSFSEVKGYKIGATNGDIGHVVDLLVDSDVWRVTHLVVDTRNWLPGHHVVIDAGLIKEISWDSEHVVVGLTRDEVKQGPEYTSATAIDEGYQRRLSDYYRNYEKSRAAWLPTREPPRPGL